MTDILLKRGASNAISNYIGKVGEIVLDSSTNHIIIQDGFTKGGIKVANVDDIKGNNGIIETYANRTSWYRIWSDGWTEQGGQYTTALSADNADISITLLKLMANTNYYVNLVRGIVGPESRYFPAYDYNMVWDLTNASFKVHVTGTSMSKPLGTFRWYCCGY